MSRKYAEFIIIGIILLGLILTGCSKKEQAKNGGNQSQAATQETQNVSQQEGFIGSEAPEFELENLSGEKVTLDQFSGKVVLLNFWATWCPPCRKEIPEFVEMYSEYEDDGLEIVGVTLNSGSAEKIQNFAYKNKMNFPILTGSKEKTMNLAQKYNIKAVPTSFVIDREGVVQHKWVGPRSKEKFMEVINKYL